MQKTDNKPSAFQIRALRKKDHLALLALINADRLPSQPECTLQDIQDAVAGKATIDGGWWKALTTIHTLVVTSGTTIVGAASFGIRKQDGSPFAGAGFLLWLHANERRDVTDLLVSYIRSALQHCSRLYAFWIATPLTLGVEGLPKEHRPMMHEVLLRHGFTGADQWVYMKGPVQTEETQMIAEVEQTNTGWKLLVHDESEQVAEAEIGLGRDALGVLWWIEVQESQRGRGIGKHLLLQARKMLGDAGVKEIILYVDHDDPRQRDRTAALHLYRSQGFCVVDHLWSYHKVP